MSAVWFWLIAVMLTVYSILDGFDLGVGALHLFVARTDEERRSTLNAIGPVWNGNEVWLLAAGGMLVVSFPRVYAAGFSGFYLALILVLWCLIARGVAIEFRSQFASPLWRSFWDTIFWIGSLLLCLLLGVALGNVLRGLPIDETGYFNGSLALLLNPYSLVIGVLSVAVLLWHGANYLALKTEGGIELRARRTAGALYWVVLLMTVIATGATFLVRRDLPAGWSRHPYLFLLPAIAVLALVLGGMARVGDRERTAFRASALLIAGLLGSAAATAYPTLLRSTINPAFSLDIHNAAAAPHGLMTAFLANMVGLVAVVIYVSYAYRIFRGKVRKAGHGY
jgi:cytochrome d ubiquinol oxidase subunit II